MTILLLWEIVCRYHCEVRSRGAVAMMSRGRQGGGGVVGTKKNGYFVE